MYYRFLYVAIFIVTPIFCTTSDATQALRNGLAEIGFKPLTLNIPDKKAFLEKYKLPSKIQKKLDACFKQADIQPDDIGTLTFCDKLESVGFTFIKKSWFGEGKQHHSTVIAECPPSVGSYIIKVEARQDRLKINSHQNMFRILLAQAINDYANEHGLKYVKTPRKYLYHIPQAGEAVIDKNFLIVAKKVSIDTSKKITDLSAEQLAEFVDIISAVWMIDVKFYRSDHPRSSNTVLDTKGRIVFLDTQPLCDLWTSRPIHDLMSKGFSPVPIQGIIANALMDEGLKQNNKDYVFRGQHILKTIYVLYRELFYFYAIHRSNDDAKKIIAGAIQKCSQALEMILAQPLPRLDTEEITSKVQKYKAVCLKEHIATKYLPPHQKINIERFSHDQKSIVYSHA